MAALIARPSSEALKNLIPLILLGAFWALLLWVAPWRAAKSQFTKQPSAQGPRTLMVDDSGIHWRWDSGSSDIQWKNLIRWQETKTHFFIYSSPIMFNIVPKRALSDEEVTQFRSFLAKHIPSGRRAAAGQQ